MNNSQVDKAGVITCPPTVTSVHVVSFVYFGIRLRWTFKVVHVVRGPETDVETVRVPLWRVGESWVVLKEDDSVGPSLVCLGRFSVFLCCVY